MNFYPFVINNDVDIIALSDTKLSSSDIQLKFSGYLIRMKDVSFRSDETHYLLRNP